MNLQDSLGSRREKTSREAPSWRDLYQTYQDGQYYLFDSSTGQPTAAAISPSPFFKPGVEALLQEFEKPPAERNPSAIAAGAACRPPSSG
jgi:hypothetical protein